MAAKLIQSIAYCRLIFLYKFNQILFMLIKALSRHFKSHFSTLTKTKAQTRANYIAKNSIDYTYHLTLHKGAHYDGLTNITFQVNHQANPQYQHLRIDFNGKEITGLLVNDQIIHQPSRLYYEGAIHIPTFHLKKGSHNNITIQYANLYDKDGNGCVSFIDVDTKQYLYTQFEPYFANRVFPHFDQPDLKAPMALTISCPSDWGAVLSNQNPIPSLGKIFNVSEIARKVIQNAAIFDNFTKEYEKKIPDDYKTTSFMPTKLLPSYLYCFVVGPYKQLLINTKLIGKENYIPMKLYSIQSLYPQLLNLAPYIEEITVQSMQFFQKYFGYKYPFSKYDQVFAHEYKWGAMENAGIVTLNDLYLFKDKVSDEKLLSFGNTIVHELAHHWFGNLVTMKWWDDLWLNESFAEYISHFCLQKIRKDLKTISFESAMLSFFNRKAWGYAQDKLMTTHSIRSEVDDTFTAESIFDGITYSKGAATMKQLMYLVGEDAFSQALKAYFHKYEFSNAVLDDLLASIEAYFQKSNLGYSLTQWKEMWLETAGTNVLSCDWNAGSNKIIINQGFDLHCSTLRLHRIKIALVQSNHKIIEAEALVYPQEKTEVLINVPSDTVAVLLNYQDLTFATVQLDEQSRNYFSQNLQKVEDVLSRALVWKAYYNMLIDAKITSKEFVKFVLNNIAAQTSDPIFQQEIAHLHSAVNLYTPKKYREALSGDIYNTLKRLYLSQADKNSNRSTILKDKLIDFAYSSEQQKELAWWYYGQAFQFSREDLNNTLRWKIVVKICSGDSMILELKRNLLEDMIKRDPSDAMINKKLTCQALLADSKQLQQIYSNFFNQNNNLSITNTVSQMRGFNHEFNYKLIKEIFYKKYFQDARRLLNDMATEEQRWFVKGDYLENFIVHMDPVVESTVDELERKIRDFKGLQVKNNDKIKRTILKKMDLLERRKRIYELFIEKEGSKFSFII